VLRPFGLHVSANSARLREVAIRAVEERLLDRDCPCPHALDGVKLPFDLP